MNLELFIERHSTKNGRYYSVSPEALWRFYSIKALTKVRYPSVTTILSAVSDDRELREWQKRVGKRKAEAIKNAAAKRGTAVHSYIEAFYTNKTFPALTADELRYVEQAVPVLNKCKPLFLEQPVFWADNRNPRIGFAGTLDACFNLSLNGKNTNIIADFKTWTKPKSPKYLFKYSFQLAAYCGALNYLTNGLYKINEALILGLTPSNSYLYFLDKDSLREYWETWLVILDAYFNSTAFDWNTTIARLPIPQQLDL